MISIQTWAEVAPTSTLIEISIMVHVQEEVIRVILINKCLTMTIADSLHPNIPRIITICKIDDIMRLMTTIVVMMAVE